MEPSSSPIGMKMDDSQPKLIQNWHKNGECPQGTIPIRRTQNHDLHRTFPFHRQGGQHYYPFGQLLGGHKYAFVTKTGSTYYGEHASFNVWNPKTEANEFCLSQIWVMSDKTTLNTIEAGWMGDNYQSTGCYDLSCPGFVQTNHKFAIGCTIKPVSTYNEKAFAISMLIYKELEEVNVQMHVASQATVKEDTRSLPVVGQGSTSHGKDCDEEAMYDDFLEAAVIQRMCPNFTKDHLKEFISNEVPECSMEDVSEVTEQDGQEEKQA
ncbi:uncharacterized protein LOC114283557 [Camellia sinensis]|uniref:uncharacterized protein LOC114283557 n=1 Tax=Camellia sinensis TaxID=4442 RepID=UPI0010365E7E|nr:uncharacterized protein LOC114283557 [Camellia sinensis]